MTMVEIEPIRHRIERVRRLCADPYTSVQDFRHWAFKYCQDVPKLVDEVEQLRVDKLNLIDWLRRVALPTPKPGEGVPYCRACGAIQLQRRDVPDHESHRETCPLYFPVPDAE